MHPDNLHLLPDLQGLDGVGIVVYIPNLVVGQIHNDITIFDADGPAGPWCETLDSFTPFESDWPQSEMVPR